MKPGTPSRRTIALYDRYVMPTYRKSPVVFVRGKGSWLWDMEGRKYLDLFPGWGVSALGHCHPDIVRSIRDQAGKLLHIANNYYNEVQGRLAREISRCSFDGKCFFSNSGAEAVEGAIKLSRKFGHERGRYKIISALGSFHGRTLAALTATGQKKYQEGFDPLTPGFTHIPFNDMAALRSAFDRETCAVLLEVVQGEGGVHVAAPEFLSEARRLCDVHGALLILDEVQTGMGRTGKMFAFQHFNVQPDIMTLAKALGAGVAIGAMIAQRRIADVLQPATHATTYGGNPLVCRAALEAFHVMKRGRLVAHVRKMGAILEKHLRVFERQFPVIKEVRGMGLMMGVELEKDGTELVKQCLADGLVINCTQGNVIRFLPAYTVTEHELDLGMKILRKNLEAYGS